MQRSRFGLPAGGALALLLALTSSAQATTLVRASLSDLVATNSQVVVGEVVDAYSYWNPEGTFILTDVTLATREVVKGESGKQLLTITLLGGSVDGLSTVILGNPQLVPGYSYVLFLNRENLPGAACSLTLRDLCQGSFEIQGSPGKERAVSQAVGEPLLPDRKGQVEAVGGAQGLPLATLLESVRNAARQGVRK